MADAAELLKTWPGWSNAGAEAVLASPAWRYEGPGGRRAERRAGLEGDVLWLDAAFDGSAAKVGIADSELYPDLHKIWRHRGALPEALLFALAERECGDVFELLEGMARMQFSLSGISREAPAKSWAFAATGLKAEAGFAVSPGPELAAAFGRLEFIDPGHESVRSMEREVWADFGAVELGEEELERLKAGDYILAPEAEGEWRIAPPEGVRIIGAATARLKFSDFADGTCGTPAAAAEAALAAGGRQVAKLAAARVGLAAAYRVTERIG